MQCLATLNEHDHMPEESARRTQLRGLGVQRVRLRGGKACAHHLESGRCEYGLGTLCRGKFTQGRKGEPSAKGVVNNGEYGFKVWCVEKIAAQGAAPAGAAPSQPRAGLLSSHSLRPDAGFFINDNPSLKAVKENNRGDRVSIYPTRPVGAGKSIRPSPPAAPLRRARALSWS